MNAADLPRRWIPAAPAVRRRPRSRVTIARIVAVLATLASILVCASPAGCRRAQRPGIPPRNLLLVTFESLRADHMSCYGHLMPTSALSSSLEERETQRAFGLDDLASNGVLFANAFAPSGSTLASLASLFTGCAPPETAVLDDATILPEKLRTLAEMLRDRGFETAAFVSARGLDLQTALGRGFRTFTSTPSDREAIDAATLWLERDFGDEKPVFVWIHLSAPSIPWLPLPMGTARDSARRFADPSYAGPADGTAQFFQRVAAGGIALSPADVRQASLLYDERVAAAADELTRCLRAAFDFTNGRSEATELWSRTLLVFTSPHGIELGERGGFESATSLFDEALHVPLFFRHPDSLTGERVFGDVVELADVMPTLLDWFGIEGATMSGRSLLARTDSYVQRPFEERAAVAVIPGPIYSLRTRRWRLVSNRWKFHPEGRPKAAPPIPPIALFDLSNDRAERENVAADHPKVVEDLQGEMKGWRERLDLFRGEVEKLNPPSEPAPPR